MSMREIVVVIGRGRRARGTMVGHHDLEAGMSMTFEVDDEGCPICRGVVAANIVEMIHASAKSQSAPLSAGVPRLVDCLRSFGRSVA